jgi:exopolysaccharide/PEP-CTERM locus tyrosine autokinase
MNLIERAMQRGGAAHPPDPADDPDRDEPAITLDRIEQAVARAGADDVRTFDDRRHGEALREPRMPLIELERPADRERGESQHVDVDLARLASIGMVTPEGEKTPVFEEFRNIKRPLITNATGRGASRVRNGNLIMVTSAVPGEGKSFCSVNLAMSMALERDHTVLLVDADVARPSVHQMLGFSLRAGLMDVLVGEKQLADVILSTNVDKLRVLPAGTPHRHATEVLASAAMGDLLEEMATRYSDRIIVFDSPPLLATSEARVLAQRMGQVVVVVEAGRTTQRAVQDALREVEECEIVGLIYNKSSGGGGDRYGYYGYGGYGKQ